MKEIIIQDIKPGLVTGVTISQFNINEVYKENYFEWKEFNLIASFGSSDISGGIINSKNTDFIFSEVETHIDNEMFYFISGSVVMIFSEC